jgi:hypothetical protein
MANKVTVIRTFWAGYPDKRAGFLAGGQPPHETVLAGVRETQIEIDHGADGHRDSACQTGAGYTQRWCPEVPENEHIIQKDITCVHQDQRRHI